MKRFAAYYNTSTKVSTCKKCGAAAIIDANPDEGELDIRGSAPYSYCYGRPIG
jgi:hypothetical protein